MRSITWIALLISASTHAQLTTIFFCESYSYTATSTFTEYSTVTAGGIGGSRSSTTLSMSLTSLTLPPASTSTSMTDGGISGSSRSTTTTIVSNNVPGNGTSVLIPDGTVTPATPIPTTTMDRTSTSSTTVTLTDPTVTNQSFNIVFNVPNPGRTRLVRRALVYLSFDEGSLSILVSDQADAASFVVENGVLKSGSLFVVIDTTSGAPRFKLQAEQSTDPVTIQVDNNGNVSLPGIEGLCRVGDDLLVIEENTEAPPQCQSIEPELIAAETTASSTSSTISVTTSTSVSMSASTISTSLSTAIGTTSSSSVSQSSSVTTIDSSSSSTLTMSQSTTSVASEVTSTTDASSTTSELTSPTSSPSTTGTSSADASTTSTTNLSTMDASSTSSSATVTTTSSGPTVTDQAYIDTVLRTHNRHRANHTADPLVWNDAMAATAKKIADGCVYAHDTKTDCPGDNACYGQNIGAGYLSTQMGFLISDGFYNGEVNFYTYYGGEPDTSTLLQWGHFSQIVWKDVSSVGCYTSDCSASGLGNIDPSTNIRPFFTVCNYDPPGNYIDEFAVNVIAPVNFPTITAGYQCPTEDNCVD